MESVLESTLLTILDIEKLEAASKEDIDLVNKYWPEMNDFFGVYDTEDK